MKISQVHSHQSLEPTVYSASSYEQEIQIPVLMLRSRVLLPHRLLVIMVLFFFLRSSKPCTPCSSLLSSSSCSTIHFFTRFLLLCGSNFLKTLFHINGRCILIHIISARGQIRPIVCV
ncbi:hypothetical protein V8G54_008036 [Vigna mungo]|uniref:Uncharacterized protein n=1 Tax=Vigna mungo TaxID=3915 RepID=A0AAQ3P2S9_VIGMU